MILTELKIHSLRNIYSAQVVLNPRFNFIVGSNGSGKTSVLEAFSLLSCGHSFRSREISSIISYEKKLLTVFAHASDQQSVSIQKSQTDPTQIKLNNQFCNTTSQLAYALPCQVFYSDLFQIIDAGSSVRRSLIDWGLFHVKQSYLSLWKEYKKVLKQRNALLKTRAPYEHFIPWDKQMNTLANEMTQLREEYFAAWALHFAKVLPELTDVSCSVQYFKGWDKKNTGKPLDRILADAFASDLHKQYTQYGPHQADILIENNENKAKQALSRGQQKIILFALKLAQADLLNSDCLYLIDDLASELDKSHQEKLLRYLASRTGQYVITSTTSIANKDLFNEEDITVYNLSNGTFTLI